MVLKTIILIPLLVGFLGFLYFYQSRRKKVLQSISDNWCKKPRKNLSLSSLFYCIGIAALFLSLLDIRGNPKEASGVKSLAHTIILLDTSLSMLAEDLKPNRVENAIIHLKHFINKTSGHLFELHVFSDQHKRVLAFTEDKDLLITRIDALKNINVVRGGSDINVSIKAALSSFKLNGIENGNILLVTDGDLKPLRNLDTDFELKNFNLAVLQASASSGSAKIPLRTPDGRLKFYKRFKGKEVRTGAKEEFFSSVKSNFKNLLVVRIDSFNFKSGKIANFFKNNKVDQGEMLKFYSRPVYASKILMVFFICIIAFYFLKLKNGFRPFIIIFSLVSFKSHADELIQKFSEGRISYEEIINLSYKEIKNKNHDLALTLLKENVDNISTGNISEAFNLGSLYLQKGNLEGGSKVYKKILDVIENQSGYDKLKEKIKRNMLLALNQQGSGGGKGNQQQNESEQSKSDDKNQNDSDGDSNQNKRKQKPRKNAKSDGIIQQILNDDKKSHEKYLKTEFKKGRVRNNLNDW